jgi:hypothetical protein
MSEHSPAPILSVCIILFCAYAVLPPPGMPDLSGGTQRTHLNSSARIQCTTKNKHGVSKFACKSPVSPTLLLLQSAPKQRWRRCVLLEQGLLHPLGPLPLQMEPGCWP